MVKRQLVEVRNAKIYARYGEMYFGELMREEEIYKILEKEFYLAKRTIYGVILNMSKESEPKC